jgi:putative hydrolase of the HAD superfamily
MRFDAVAFDLDGTLYPALRLYILAFPGMLRRARRLGAFNTTRRSLRAQGLDEAQRACCPAKGEEFRSLEARLVADRLGIAVPEAETFIQRDFYRGVDEMFSRIKPFAGVLPALDALAAGGRRLALLSDLPPLRKLELLGLSGRFEPALCSEDSGFLKPALDPFAMLASCLDLPYERILYVGNSPAIDVAGAKAAGMAAAIVSRRPVKGADLSFFDWRKLVDFALSD